MAGKPGLEAARAILTHQPGTYALALRLDAQVQTTIGALGEWTLPEGFYVYVGSAWGPGGLAARIGHHLRRTSVPRWHIDYLRWHGAPVAVWLAPGSHAECAWADVLLHTSGLRVIVPRFGASDCKCTTHLFWNPAWPDHVQFPARGPELTFLDL